MRYFQLLCSAALLCGSAPAFAANNGKGMSNNRKAIAEAGQAFEARDCAKVKTLLAPVLANPKTEEADDLSRAYDLSITCALQGKDLALAADYATRAIAQPESSDFAWRIAIGLKLEGKNYGGGIDTIEQMLAQGRGKALNSIDPRWLMRALYALDQNGDDRNETRLLAILANLAYDPDDVQAQIESIGDYARARYARKLLTAGKSDEARGLVSEIKGFETMALVAFDPEMRVLLDKPVDLRAVAEADLVRHRALLERYPSALSAITEVSFDLRRLGRHDENIAFLTAAIPQVENTGSFDDGDDKIPWFWNALAYEYFMVGDYDKMVATYGKAVRSMDHNSPNIDVIINFAERQIEFARPKEALTTLELLREATNIGPFGVVEIHKIRGCAQAQLGQLDGARAELAFAIAHEKDNPGAVTTLQLCVGDEDAAAASYLRRLNNPSADTRRNVIFALADYDAPDRRAPRSPFADRDERVRKRADVNRAVRVAAGGPVRIYLQVEP